MIDPNFKSPAAEKVNIDLMKAGRAPYGKDNNPINLHHMLQNERSALAEVTQTFHQKHSRALHINSGSGISSGVDRTAFKTWKKHYWKKRATDFIK